MAKELYFLKDTRRETRRTLCFFLLTLLAVCAPLAAQTIDTQSVTITYNGSSSANTSTVHVTNATNVTARIGSNIDSTGAVVFSAGNTAGAFLQNVSDSGANSFLVNIGTDQNVLGALSRRGATTYTGATLLISATGCTDCISVALTLQITNGGGVTITYNGAAIPNTGISLFTSVGGFTSAQLVLASTNPTAFQATSSQFWLSVIPTSGQLMGQAIIQLSANAAGLPSGAHQSIVQISAGGVTTSITVTLNVGTAGGLTLNPNPMNFSYVTSMGSFPSGQTQFLSISGASTSATYTATVFSSPQWLLVGAGGGTTVTGISTLSQLPVSVNPAVLNLSAAATYTGTVNITTTDGLTATLTVSFSISASGTTGGTGTLTFTVPASGAAAPPPQQITISGSGSFAAFVGTNNCGQGWLLVSPNSGQLSSIATTLTVQVFPGNIGVGTCTGTIAIATTGLLQNGMNFQNMNVTMQIGTSGGGGPVASPAALTFTMPNGATQSRTIIVNGDGSAFSAQAIGTNLSVFPANGTTPAILTVSANSNSSSGTIVVNSSLGTQNVGVTVNVLGGNVLTANPAALSFVYTAGSSIANQSIGINASLDSSGSNLTWTVTSAPSFVSYAVTSPTTPSTIGVAINTAQLGPGFNTGNIVLTANGAANVNLTIPVTVLALGSTAGLSASPNPVSLSAQQFGRPVTQLVSLTGLSGASFTATSISTANWLTVSPNSGTGPATLTITANPGTLLAQAAPYSGTVTVTANNGATLNILVNLTVSTTTVPPAVLSVGPPSANVSTLPMTITFSDPRGWQDLGVLNILINNGLDAQHGCYLAYINSISTLALVNDAGTAGGPFAGTVTAGSLPTVINNSQCGVTLISAVGSGTTFTLQLNFTFNFTFAGSRIVYVAARDQAENNSGWQPMGVWQVPGPQNGPITVTGLSPSRGQAVAGTAQTYTLTWTDSKGVSDLGILNVLVNNGLDAGNACYLAYIATGNANILVLVNDAGNAGGPFAGSMTLGTPQVIQNSQCIVNGAASSAVLNGTSVTLNLNIAFKSALSGNRILYLAGRDGNGLNNTGWQAMGTWQVQ